MIKQFKEEFLDEAYVFLPSPPFSKDPDKRKDEIDKGTKYLISKKTMDKLFEKYEKSEDK